MTVLDSGFNAVYPRIPGTGFRILIVSRIPESLSCILDSKTNDSGFQKKNLSGFWTPQTKPPEFWNLESLAWGE